MNTWKKSRPTFRGKELILKALMMSKSWFLATVKWHAETHSKRNGKEHEGLPVGWKKKGPNNNGSSQCPKRRWRTRHT